MAITGSLLTDVSDISAGFAIFWLIFLTSLYLLWSRLPLSIIRGALWIGLGLYQLRWGSAWLVLPPAEAPVATIAAIVYTPMLLMIFGLMEGQRRGVIVGITVAVFMGVTATLGSLRPEMSEVALNDPRLGTLITVLIALYVFIQNAWSAQQTLLEERGVEAALLQAKVNTDDLTGMLNRKGLDIAVTGWLTRRSPFGVLMLKIDAAPNTPDNKSSGDDDGAVDELSVKNVSRLIDEAMRDSDLVGRWSHDEFLVLCRDEDPKRILGFGNRMRVIIEEETAPTSIPLTVSVGVSLFPLFEHFDDTVERVTTALREAQAAGKNCVKAQWRTGVAL
jgi:diguanylate cyclase (GGDEF)-like protein